MLKKYGFKIATILSILLFSAVFAYTHSGRTDKYGGHHDRKNGGYHYHNSGTVPRSTTRPTTPSTPIIPKLSTSLSYKIGTATRRITKAKRDSDATKEYLQKPTVGDRYDRVMVK